ncbi:isochorismate synthase [Falsibacillus pallidus]|uniref:Isochorismate synthase MenF n=1 Tax=Falsibacillus pallidus TaxID=493781 RepID=A0A370GL34_9BACI|nr:isochorismate synthase [Falsibacillus pallidus]RDI44377.1 isochorismate synthase [Falsibacillus pallidus]
MAIIQQSKINNAFMKAKQENRQVLFSSTIEVQNAVDPLTFFKNGKEKYRGERFFWKDSSNELILAGIGVEKSFQYNEVDHRFFEAESEWKRLIDDAVIDNPSDIPGTGPLLFGGYSFDPLSEKEEEWADYAASQFYLPRHMLTISQGKKYLTVNILCMPNNEEESAIQTDINDLLSMGEKVQGMKSGEEASIEEINKEAWIQAVEDVIEKLRAGELQKVVLARKIKAVFKETIKPPNVLEALLNEQPDSFTFAFESGESCFIGASPERLIRKNGSKVLSTCLAGSIRRGTADEEDNRLGLELLNDQKNLQEHAFVVRMIESVFAKYCKDVEIPEGPTLLKLRDIQHLYTPVVGTIDEETPLSALIQSLHPTPALGGEPREKAMEVIRQKEKMDRGLYAAPIGWFDYRGNGEFAVAIRSGLLKNNEAFLYAGCGVVADSDPLSEYTETRIKLKPMLRAVGGIES